MNKIPVVKTIEYAYSFTFENLGAIIGLIWLPMVLVAVGGFFSQTLYSQAIATALQEGRPAAAGQAVISLLAWSLVSLLLNAIIYVAVTRQALGLRKGPAMVHFALGPAEFRMFGAEIVLVLVLGFFLMTFAILIGSLTTMVKAGGSGAAVASIALLAVAIAGLCGFLFIAVRLSFLLFTATVAEEKIGLARSWMLTRGNFWRIVLIGLATLGPLIVLMGITEFIVLGPDVLLGGLKPGETLDQAQLIAQNSAMMAHLPILLGISLLIAPFMAGLTLAPAAYAYRALVPGKPVEA